MAQFGNLSQPLNVVGRLFSIEHWTTQSNQAAVSRIWYRVSAVSALGVTYSEALSSAAALTAPLYKACVGAPALFKGLGIRELRTPGIILPAPAYDNGAVGAGGMTGTALPHQTCGLLSIRTAAAGRAGRGRMYMPFPSTACADASGTVSASYAAALGLLAAVIPVPFTMTGAGGTITVVPSLVSPKALTYKTLTAVLVSGRFATQRRRGDYGRVNVSPV